LSEPEPYTGCSASKQEEEQVYNTNTVWFKVSSSTKISKHLLLPTPAKAMLLSVFLY
jgi:hypothetical protein